MMKKGWKKIGLEKVLSCSVNDYLENCTVAGTHYDTVGVHGMYCLQTNFCKTDFIDGEARIRVTKHFDVEAYTPIFVPPNTEVVVAYNEIAVGTFVRYHGVALVPKDD